MPEIAQTADHALRILLQLGDRGPMTPAELAVGLELNRTVVHRLLTTLNARGFVRREGFRYAPGPALVKLADGVQPDLRAVALRAMASLSERADETAVVHVPDGPDAVVLAQVVAEGHLLRVDHRIGSRHPLVLGASGRAILAFLKPADRRRILRTAASPKLEAALEQVADQGYAASHDELQLGVHGLAAPVLDADGMAIASIGLLAPANRGTTLGEHLDALWETTAAVGAQLGRLDAAPEAVTPA